MTKTIRILNLGDIVAVNIQKTIAAFAATIANKKVSGTDINKNANIIAEISKSLTDNMKDIGAVIEQFKLGAIDEPTFNQNLSAALEKATGIKLSDQEIDEAWKAGLPEGKSFEALLKQAIEFNKQPNQQLVFISATNPKDMRHLQWELHCLNIPCSHGDNFSIKSIDGISIHSTYVAKKTKAQLIETVIKDIKNTNSLDSITQSLNSVIIATNNKQEQSDALEEDNIKYIRGVNNINDPFFKSVSNETNTQTEQKAAGFKVDTLIWDKSVDKDLTAFFNNKNITANQHKVANL